MSMIKVSTFLIICTKNIVYDQSQLSLSSFTFYSYSKQLVITKVSINHAYP